MRVRSLPNMPRVRHVEVDGCRVRVAETGRGEPLLLINGIGASFNVWRPVVQHLGDHRRIILFDAPGTGGSTGLDRPLRMRGLATLVDEMLDRLGEDQVDLLGYSWGGALAQQLAHDSPSRVRNLVLVASSPGLGGPFPTLPVLLLASSPLLLFSTSYLKWAAPRIFGGEVRCDRGGLAGWVDEPPDVRGLVHQVLAISGWTSLSWLHRLGQPTLVLSGTDDPLVPVESATLLASRIPDARLTLIPDAGHLWLLQQAQRSTALIDEFLSG